MRYRAIPEYYDAEYAQQAMLQQDVPFFLSRLSRRQSVLEMAVGTGRAAIPIAQAGHRLVGLDNDPRMLDRARTKRDGVGLGERELTLLEGDMLTADLGRTFDWVCVFFNTFLVFTSLGEQDRALQAMRRHLKPRGRLWLDVLQPDLLLLARKRSVNLEPMVFYVPERDRTVFKSIEVRPDPARQVQRVVFHYLWFDAQGRERRQKTAFDLSILFPLQLEMLLERNGFKVEHLYGNYDGSFLNADSPRMIACARRD